MKKLPIGFYKRENVVLIAKEILGKIVITTINGIITSGRIVETEAYAARADKASHAYGGRRTNRNEPMYAEAGTKYVYICYGMHTMLNVVTNNIDVPDAILIRALHPLVGVDEMLQRTGKRTLDNTLTKGPGNLAKAMGITKAHNGLSFKNNSISIFSDGFVLPHSQIINSPRIGVAGAGEDALLPYRFYVKGDTFVSGSKKSNKEGIADESFP